MELKNEMVGNALEVLQHFYEVDTNAAYFIKNAVEIMMSTDQTVLECDGGKDFDFEDLNIKVQMVGTKVTIEILK